MKLNFFLRKLIYNNLGSILEIFLNRALCKDLQQWLFRKLQIGAQDAPRRLADLISQDPVITATRVRLEAEVAKLKDVQRELRNLGIYGDSGNFFEDAKELRQ